MCIRDRIDATFDAWGHTAFRHRWSLILTMLVVTALFCSGLGRVTMEASTESYLKPDDPARVSYNIFRSQFSNDEKIVLVFHSENIFSFELLEKLRNLHRDLEQEMPSLDRVTSLVNARVTRGEGDELIVEDLLEQWPSTDDDLRALSKRARVNPAYRNTLLSEDGRYTTITIEITPGTFPTEGAATPARWGKTERFGVAEEGTEEGIVPQAKVIQDEELKAIAETLDSIVHRHEGQDFEVHQAGACPITYAVLKAVSADMRLFTGLSNALIGILLYVLFRRISGVFLTLAVVTPALMDTFGFMGLVGFPITPTSQILPSFLLAVCVADGVHILSIFYREFDRGSDKESSLAFALKHSGLAVVMTSVTTAGGLGSFAFADLTPLVGLGVAAPVGIMLGLVYSVVLLPALIAVLPLRRRSSVTSRRAVQGFDGVLAAIGDVSTRRPGLVVSIWSVLILLALYGAVQLQFSYAAHKWFSKDHPIRIAFETANRAMKGVIPLEVIVDSERENGLYDPDLMNRLDAMRQRAEVMMIDTVRAGKAVSILDVLKETNRSLNENDPAYYTIPQSRELIAQELLLFETSGSDDLERFVDPAFRKTRMTLLLPWEDGLRYIPYLREAREVFQEMAGEMAEVEVTGLVVLYARVVSHILHSTARSYVIAVIVVAPLLVLLIGNLRLGLVSLIPNLTPVIVGMGIIYWMGSALDVFTIMIGSIIIGVAVDNTIHFMYNFRRYYGATGDVPTAVHETLLSTGRAIVVSSIALCFGFIVFVGATMKNVQSFGVITSLSVVTALLADLFLSPALVALVVRASKSKISVAHEEEGRRGVSVEVRVLSVASQPGGWGSEEDGPRPTRPEDWEPSKRVH